MQNSIEAPKTNGDTASKHNEATKEFIIVQSPTSNNIRCYNDKIATKTPANAKHGEIITTSTPNHRKLEESFAFSFHINKLTMFAPPGENKNDTNSLESNTSISETQENSKKNYSTHPTKHIKRTITIDDLQSGDRGKTQNQVMGMSAENHAIAAAISKLKDQIFEWLHMQGYELGGEQAAENLACGDYASNRFMLKFENWLHRLLTDKKVKKIDLDITAHLRPANDGSGLYTHIADKLIYTITCAAESVTLEFLPQRNYRPSRPIGNSLRNFCNNRIVKKDHSELTIDNIEEKLNHPEPLCKVLL
jgi:hypothetical protein